MYRILKVEINKRHSCYQYLENIGKLSNNLYNATLFRVRQLMSSRIKENLSDNEKEILEEVKVMNSLLLKKGKKEREICPSGAVNYYFLVDLLKLNENYDYIHKEIPTHTAQAMVRLVTTNIKSFFEALKVYNVNPEAFTGRPELPKYKKKKGISSFKFSNQECVIKKTNRGNYYAKLPYTKETIKLGKKHIGNLKEVQVTYENQRFLMCFIFEDEEVSSKPKNIYKNICAIDLGLDNLMAVTNNIGAPNLLYKGKHLKSVNHLYNKKIASIVSHHTKGTTDKYTNPSGRYYAITNKRNNQIDDYISKVAKHLILWCVENRIDTIIIGNNKQWKNEINLGKVNNQNFVQIPHGKLKFAIQYRAEQKGINFIETEESYTSKASFLDKDEIPVYKEGDETEYKFSGKRIKRGLYKSKDGIVINADLNGSANIMRKVFDDVEISFQEALVIKM